MNARLPLLGTETTTTHVFHRQLHHALPVAVSGHGITLTDAAGKTYLDASGGAAVSCLGHGHPDVIAAMHAQIDQLAYAHTSFFTTQVAEELADLLIDTAPAGMSHVYFVSGGSEAVEAALKMARQYFVEIGQPQRQHFIARRQSYHGNTLGALAVGGNEWRRAQFKPILIDVTHVSPCYEYRDRRADESAEQYGQRLVSELSDAIDRLGGENVMAFVAETIGGATAGVLTPVPGYFKGIRELCDRHGILLILDEVMCGMGRTGTLHACEQEGVVPDLLTIAKGLGGGYQPIGAVLAQGKLVDAFRQGSGLFQHGHTYLGHAVACAAAGAAARAGVASVAEAGFRPPPPCGRHSGPRSVLGCGAGGRPSQQAVVRSSAQAPHPAQARRHGRGVDGLPYGRHGGWALRRPRVARATLHCLRGRAGADRPEAAPRHRHGYRCVNGGHARCACGWRVIT